MEVKRYHTPYRVVMYSGIDTCGDTPDDLCVFDACLESSISESSLSNGRDGLVLQINELVQQHPQKGTVDGYDLQTYANLAGNTVCVYKESYHGSDIIVVAEPSEYCPHKVDGDNIVVN